MSNLIPKNALIVVADGRKATLFRNESNDGVASLHEERRLSPKYLLNDGPSGSRPVEQSPHQTDEATFAKQLSEVLYKMKHDGQFDGLILVADPQTLGQLRDTMHKTVTRSLLRTIPKDLTNHTAEEISEALR